MSDERALAKVSTRELHAEIARRDEECRQQKLAEHTEHEQLVCENIDVLLRLVPEHGRTSCTDANYVNYNGRCLRCALIYARSHSDFPYWLRLSLEEYER